MRVVSAGDLRVNAPVSNDPIGMLANAFNFTVGRFRRFVLRTHGAVEQLDVIVRHEIERAENFLQAINKLAPATPTSGSRSTPSGELRSVSSTSKDIQTELVRLSFDFAAEIVTQSRKLTSVTHEMRQGAISFQLDATNSSDLLAHSQPLSYNQGNNVVPEARPPRGQYSPTVNREPSPPNT
jgi:methyl-accepting chemotaxis protein